MRKPTMHRRAAGSHGENHDIPPTALDVMKALTGKAHRDSERNVKQSARRYRTGERTQYTYQREGSPEMRAFQLFLLKSAFACRQVATLLAFAQRCELEGKTLDQVIQLYHEALAHEKAAEARDTNSDLARDDRWALDGAVAAERDLAWDARKAACLRYFAEHRVSRERVWR